ncbi:alveolin domain containing intermediate filament IMC4 [Cardiosporidium cionae]|uniref:Alveolin domain containing intermediate filament IMC4 n=1 Tax=Cardiosporidium cionae TaxID=476202 RepID=A0ABQ7JES8_9APIC|nr:alveolin domain containing intermediate filament IMC4 [Cardiosporidium cionae]|eukprot:KAF8822508.1 alveolin domain containing intermediate filament IMC4 [Cardiosporidium cionae]
MWSNCYDCCSPCDQNGSAKRRNSQEGEEFYKGNAPPPNAKILEAITQEKIVEVMREEIDERIIEVPQIQYIEKIVEVPHNVVQETVIHVPKPIIQERIKEIQKPIYQEKIVEVPQLKVVDRIVEVPQYVYQEKLIEVPRVMVQERVIPVPKKTVVEKIVEIPSIDYSMVMPETMEFDVEAERESPSRPFELEKVVEIPHVQHTYRNVMTPQYRHIPKPVEVPMTHYRPIPVEKLVDRNVPVPVELQIIQEYLCPKIEPRYKEVPIPVHVQRTVEHPVPKEAMGNPQLLPLYYRGVDAANKSGICEPGGTCYSLFPCCSSQQARITDTEGSNPWVEVLAQPGYPQVPHTPAGIPPSTSFGEGTYQQNFAEVAGHYSQVDDGSTLQRANNQNSPYVQVVVSPQPANQTSTLEIAG